MRQRVAGSEDVRVEFQHSDAVLPPQRRRRLTDQVVQHHVHLLYHQTQRYLQSSINAEIVRQ